MDGYNVNETSTLAPPRLPSPSEYKVISDIQASYIELTFFGVACLFTSILGIAANLINIIVFIRQGLNANSASASLLGLAVTDLVNVISLFTLSILQVVVYVDPPNVSFKPWDVGYLVAGIPHLMFANITRAVTAYVAFERCMCVVIPFKVKSIFTNRVTFITVVSIFIICGMCYLPIYTGQRLGYKFDPAKNKTLVGLILSPNWKAANDAVIFATSLAFNQIPVIIVAICTSVTVFHLNVSKNWRESTASSGVKSKPQPNNETEITSNVGTTTKKNNHPKEKDKQNSKIQKELKVVKMVVLISVIFLISYIPNLIYLILKLVYPNMRTMGNYHNLAMLMVATTFLWEAINSSINILIYYKMSSRFNAEFRLLFGLKDADGH